MGLPELTEASSNIEGGGREGFERRTRKDREKEVGGEEIFYVEV